MYKIHFQNPAKKWDEALPIGNGRIGALVYSGTEFERIQINEETLWTGQPIKKNEKNYIPLIGKLKIMTENRQYKEVQDIIESEILGNRVSQYMPFGELFIENRTCHKEISDYKRFLDMERAVIKSEYFYDEMKINVESFTSFSDDVLVIKYSTAGEGMLDLRLNISTVHECSVSNTDNMLMIEGRCPNDYERNSYAEGKLVYDERESIHFASGISVKSDYVVYSGTGIRIVGKEAMIVFSIATSFNGYDKMPLSEGKDFKNNCIGKLSSALSKSFEELRERHVEAYCKEYCTMEFSLVDDCKDNVNIKKDEKFMTQVLFAYGRYLALCSSRKGTQPANLQGIWNEDILPPWQCDYTVNINTQMNYWGMEAAGLSDCHEPLLKMIAELAEKGKDTATDYFDANGWCCCHNTDIWRNTNPVGNRCKWAFWNMGGAWLCRHIWEHYEYTLDDAVLKKYINIITGAMDFLMSWMVEEDGFYVTPISTSPENAYILNNDIISICKYSTMDLSIAHELFAYGIKACSILNIDNRKYECFAKKIKPLIIGSDGRLQEWNEEFEEYEKGHRHLSHLYGVFPGETISSKDKEFEAARKSLKFRLENGGGYTGWSNMWIVNFFARMGDGDKAYEYIKIQQQKMLMTNLFDKHPFIYNSAIKNKEGTGAVFQIDGNLGFVGAICNMLVYSDSETVTLLPAIPKEWDEGVVKNICIKGGIRISFTWKNNVVTSYKAYKKDKCIDQKSEIEYQYPLRINIPSGNVIG